MDLNCHYLFLRCLRCFLRFLYIYDIYEKVGDKCYCRPGFSMGIDHTFNDDSCHCLDKDEYMTSSSYYPTHHSNTNSDIFGLDNAKIGDDCFTDTDCGQIRVNSNFSVDYLSNLRCNTAYDINYPAKTIKGKCEDISTLYGI